MIVPDVNLSLYAFDEGAPEHAAARTWWEETLNGHVVVGLAWTTVLGFLRISTNPRLFSRPLSVTTATRTVRDWIACPAVRLVDPGPRHADILLDLLDRLGTAGNLTSDAHLAAIAIEQGATLCSTDSDFARFAGLSWRNPLARGRSEALQGAGESGRSRRRKPAKPR